MQKGKVLQALGEYSDEVDVDEFMEKLYLLHKIEIGERQIEAGQAVSHDDAKKRLDKWLA